MAIQVLGLDIGGANLKAAHTGGAALTKAFALWKHPDRLGAELANLRAAMPPHEQLAVTMTGELCDCFETKGDGVRAILRHVQACAEGTPIRVWSLEGRFIDLEAAWAEPLSVAAANWLALAHEVARLPPRDRALLIDTGSTTTDFVYLNRGQPEPRGRTDRERLASGELVYTGLRRTPICAVLGMEVAAEFFATMLDACVLLGLVGEDAGDCDTADGRPRTRPFAHARLARMRCADADTFSRDEACSLAQRALQVQQSALLEAMRRVTSGRADFERVIVSGSGEIVAQMAAERLGKPVTRLSDTIGPALSEAACAHAIAQLAAREFRHE